MKIMNSPEDVQQEPVQGDEAAGNGFITPDTNANMSNESKGAIPKKPKILPLPKQSIKLNNNIESMSTLNSEEPPKLNGVSNGIPSGYLEDMFKPSCSAADAFYQFDLPKDEDDTEPYDTDDTELLSVSDDGCIYTYKGDYGADFPSSFFTFDVPPPEVPHPSPERRTESPEMDFLEMDFDPGVNGDVDSNSDEENEAKKQQEIQKVEIVPLLPLISNEEPSNSRNTLKLPLQAVTNVKPEIIDEETSTTNNTATPNLVENVQKVVEREMPWSCSLSQRTKSINFRVSKRTHCTKGELVSPNENIPKIKGASVPIQMNEMGLKDQNIEPAMIWSKSEAFLKQMVQIGPSACGETALLNVMNALRFPIPPLGKMKRYIKTKLRRNDSPLTDYLSSRSEAGTTHEDIIDCLQKISNGAIYARFFHMYPERVVNLYSWLGFWIKNGAVPIATLNLQRCLGTVPDAWHHQMIFGVDSSGIHLTNPLECVEAGLLWPQLCSESVLLVRREDVLSRWNFRTDLPKLMRITDTRWKRINVVGQVANMINESRRELRPGFTNTSHIRIPAAYSSGITLAATVSSPAFKLLQDSPELPVLEPQETNYIYY